MDKPAASASVSVIRVCVCNVFTLQNPLRAGELTSTSAASTENTPVALSPQTLPWAHAGEFTSECLTQPPGKDGAMLSLVLSGNSSRCAVVGRVKGEVVTTRERSQLSRLFFQRSSFLPFHMGRGHTDQCLSLWVVIQVVGGKVDLMNQDQLYSQKILGQRHRVHKGNQEPLIVPENTRVRKIT